MNPQALVAGEARGPVVALTEPLSFWGGFNSETGRIIDRHHPQHGARLTDAIVVMAVGRGSSSASTVIAEAIRRGTAPAALVMREPDEILTTGAIVAEEIYGRTMPIVIVDAPTFTIVAAADRVTIARDGAIDVD